MPQHPARIAAAHECDGAAAARGLLDRAPLPPVLALEGLAGRLAEREASYSIAPRARCASFRASAPGVGPAASSGRIVHDRTAPAYPARPMPSPTPCSTRRPTVLCVLRLSALGDVCHVLPVVRTLQDAWPGAAADLGPRQPGEPKLLGPHSRHRVRRFDKKAGLDAFRGLRRRFAGRRFDVLLHMQLAFRASLAAAMVPARIRVGFDRARARELQWLFTNAPHRAAQPRARARQPVRIRRALGVERRSLRWDIPLPPAALEHAKRVVPDGATDAGRQPLLEPRAAQLERRTVRGGRRSRRVPARHARADLRRPQRARTRIRRAHRRP